MDYFSEIPEGQAIVCAGGVYRQVKLAERAGRIYASYGAGFVRLHTGGTTSHPKVKWYDIDAGDGSYKENGSGVIYVAPGAGK